MMPIAKLSAAHSAMATRRGVVNMRKPPEPVQLDQDRQREQAATGKNMVRFSGIGPCSCVLASDAFSTANRRPRRRKMLHLDRAGRTRKIARRSSPER